MEAESIMSGMRGFRNSVIRNNFGVAGLRKWRELNKGRQKLLRAYRRLNAEASAIALSLGINSPQYREKFKEIERVKGAIRLIATQQLALVQPELVQVVAAPEVKKQAQREEKKPFFAGIVKGFKKLFGGRS